MFCPRCKTEYRKGITICPDCSAPLVEQLKSEKEAKEIVTAMHGVKLTSVDTAVQAELILGVLRNNQIPCYTKDPASGGCMNLYMGYSIYGKEIYVDEEDYDRALELLEVFEDTEDDLPLS